ncbi:hypothetical protein [Paraburkholderia graminis]
MRTQFRRLTLVILLSGVCPVSVWATDIDCATAQQVAARVICDHAILNHQYEHIWDRQQALARDGSLSPQDITAWQQSRDACSDVHCIDQVFAQWKALTKVVETGGTATKATTPLQQVESTPASDATQRVNLTPVTSPPRAEPAGADESSWLNWKRIGGIALAMTLGYGFYRRRGNDDEEAKPTKRNARRTQNRGRREETSRDRQLDGARPAAAPKKVAPQRAWLKDARGAVMGSTFVYGDGEQYIYAKDGKPLGFYHPGFNATFKVDGTQIAKGNMLLLLLQGK